MTVFETSRGPACVECNEPLNYIAPVNTGASNEEGPYLKTLYQCPKCKGVVIL